MSGRTLRRLPVLAHAHYLGLPLPSIPAANFSANKASNRHTSKSGKKKKAGEINRKLGGPTTEVEQWLDAMERVVLAQTGERARIDAL